MSKKITVFAMLALLGMGFTPALYSAEPPAPSTPAKQSYVEAPDDAILTTGRNGTDVIVAWSLPPDDYRSIEVTRHTQPNPRGRTSLGSVRPTKTTYADVVPDKTVTYWYWIKVTKTNLAVFNVGPAISKPVEIPTP